MIIPIKYPPSPSSKSHHPLPPQLAKIGSDELVLIEMQGALKVEGDASGQLVGKLKIVDDKKATLHIGHQLLEGEIQKLKKPLGVIYKRGGKYSDKKDNAVTYSSSSSSASRNGGEEENELSNADEDLDDIDMDERRRDTIENIDGPENEEKEKENGEPLTWEIIAIVEKKICFNKRPIPAPASVRHDTDGGGSKDGGGKDVTKKRRL